VFPETNVTAPAQLSFAGACAFVKNGMQKKQTTMIGIRTIKLDFMGWTLALHGFMSLLNRYKPNRSDKVINHSSLTQ
jgi:hypothetical protein